MMRNTSTPFASAGVRPRRGKRCGYALETSTKGAPRLAVDDPTIGPSAHPTILPLRIPRRDLTVRLVAHQKHSDPASAAARSASEDLCWTTRLWLGLTLILVVALVGCLPFQFDPPDAWILIPLMTGIVGGSIVLPILAGRRFVLALLTVLIAPTVGTGAAWMSHRLRPWAASPVSAAAAPRPDEVQSFVVRETGPMRSSGRRSSRNVTYAIAPVVEPDWRPGDPVAAWVLASEDDIAPGQRTPRAWSEPGAFLPFTPRALTITRRAEGAPPQLGPPTVDPPAIGAWVRDLGAVRHRMILRMALLTGGGMLLFTLAVLLSRRGPRSPVAPGAAGTGTQAGGDVVR